MKAKKTKIGLLLILLLVIAGGIAATKGMGKKTGVSRYQEIKVERGTIQNTVLTTGVVQPQNRLEVKPPIPGRIEKVMVEEGQAVKRGQVLGLMSSTERAALLDTAKTRGRKEIAYWEDAYKATPLMAPINGVVILRNIEEGQTVTAQDAILVMSDRLIVKAQVDETDIAQVKNEQPAEFTLDAYADHPLKGKVVHIAYDAKTVNSVTTYEVDVLPDEIPEFMKSGMTANVTFITSEKQDSLLVPNSALQREKGKHTIMIPNPDDKENPKSSEVEIGISDGKKTEIISGLNENDIILVPSIQNLNRQSKDAKSSSPFSPMGKPGGGKGH